MNKRAQFFIYLVSVFEESFISFLEIFTEQFKWLQDLILDVRSRAHVLMRDVENKVAKIVITKEETVIINHFLRYFMLFYESLSNNGLHRTSQIFLSAA
jgi:hypothetical protein